MCLKANKPVTKLMTVLAVLLAALTLMACGNGSASSSIDKEELAEVVLSVSSLGSNGMSKAISVGGGDIGVYYYKAIPQWTSASVTGKKTEWTPFANGSTIKVALGVWHFDIKVESASGNILYEASGVELEATKGTKVLAVTVTEKSGEGRFSLAVTVPVQEGADGTLSFWIDGEQVTYIDGTVEDGTISFELTRENIAVGQYKFFMTYGTLGEMGVLTIYNNETSFITGSMRVPTESGTLPIVVNGMRIFEVSLQREGRAFTCAAGANNTDTIGTCEWYLDGDKQDGVTGQTYTVPDTVEGEHVIRCFATSANNSYLAYADMPVDFDDPNPAPDPTPDPNNNTNATELFTFEVSNNGAVITGLTEYGKNNLNSLELPSSIGGYPVVGIGEDAFKNCDYLLGNLVIPDGVTSIGEDAFNRCSGFTGSLVIPNSVTSIGEDAFKSCSGFTGNLVIPDSVTSIGINAFSNCTGFTGALIIPSSVVSIGDGAFNNCTGFTSLHLSDGLKEIGTCFSIPYDEAYNPSMGGIWKFRVGVFYGCTGLTGTIVIPSTVESIGDCAFFRCEGLSGNLVIPSGVKKIGNCAFWECYNLTGNLAIPSSVTRIGYGAFSGCGFDGTLTIGNGITEIEGFVFDHCEFTGTLTIPSNVTKIGDYAFSDCTGFTGTLIIPSSVKSIGERAFGECESITALVISNGVQTIGADAFEECENLTGTLTIPSSVTSIGDGAFEDCAFTGTLNIPSSISSIGRRTFAHNNFSAVSIPASVTSIGADVFGSCCHITSITVNGNSTSYCVADGLLYDKAKTTILFCLSNNASSLTIPSSVTTISCEAFTGITNPITITLQSQTPPVGISGWDDYEPDELEIEFGYSQNTYESLLTEIRVPSAAEAAYKSSVAWGDHSDKIVGY